MKTSRYGMLLTLQVFIVHKASSATVTFTATESLVKTGATITLHCQVKDMDFSSFVRYGKYIEGQQEPLVLAINTVKQSTIKKLEKYKMNLIEQTQTPPPILDFILRVENASVEDSGNYTCSIPNDDQQTQFYHTIRVDVLVEPKSLRMYVDGVEVLSDGSELGYDEEGFHSINCTVGPSNPAAQLSVLSGSSLVLSSPDNMIQRVYSRTPMNPEFLVGILYESANEATSIELTQNDANKSISCLAKIPGSVFSITKTVTFKLRGHIAQFQCPDVLQISQLAKDGNITCSVRASPAIKILTVYWSTPQDDTPSSELRQNQTLMAELRPSDNWVIRNEYQAKLSQKGDDVKFIIKFPRLTPEIYRKYFFVARNPHGIAVHELTVEKAIDAPSVSASRSKDSNGAQPHSSTLVTAITLATCAMQLILLTNLS